MPRVGIAHTWLDSLDMGCCVLELEVMGAGFRARPAGSVEGLLVTFAHNLRTNREGSLPGRACEGGKRDRYKDIIINSQ